MTYLIWFSVLHTIGTILWLWALLSHRGYIVDGRRRLRGYALIVAAALFWEVTVLLVVIDFRPGWLR